MAQRESVQLPDGSFGGRLAVRDSATTGEALRLSRPGRPAIARIDAFLHPLALSNVDDLARVALGSPSASYPSALLEEQNDGGSFGLSRDYESDARLGRYQVREDRDRELVLDQQVPPAAR